MTAAYDALLDSVSPAFRVLVIPQPMEPLAVWTAAGGGLTNTYYCSFSTQIATDVIAGGIYRQLDEVRENATALTSRASAALVDANLGSYFHDTANSRVYVSTSTGSSPETFALIGAWFSLFFSTGAVDFSDQPVYAPIVTGQLPTLVSVLPDEMFGDATADTGTVGLLNGDGLFDRLSRRYVWRNKKVTFKLGGVGLDYSDYTTITTMRINGIAVNDEQATLQLEAIGTILNRTIPPRTFGDGNTFDIVGEGVLGLSQPILLGKVLDAKLPLISTTSERYQYIDNLYDAVALESSAVYAIHKTTRERTTLTDLVDYNDDGSTVQVFNATYTHEDYEIWADLTSGASSGLLTVGAMLERLLETVLGVSSADIDSAAFDALDVLVPHTMGLFIDEPIAAADVVRRLELSAHAQVYVNADGQWTCRYLEPSLPADYTLTDEDFAAWEPEDELSAVLNEVRVQYEYRPGSGSAKESSSSSDTVLYGSETSDSHRVLTALQEEAPAEILAEHIRFEREAAPARIRFEERGLTLMTANPGDVVAVTRARAPVARTGAYAGHLLRIVKIEKALGPDAPVVRGVLDDLHGQTDRIARCMDAATDLNWADATDEQKAVYGFCADANGYIDSADPLTRAAKVAW